VLPFTLISLWAQDQPLAPAATPQNQSPNQLPAAQKDDSKSADRAKPNNGTSKDRLFFTLPNFFTLENAADAPKLTAGQKFKTTARSTFDPIEFAWYGAQAGISQWRDHADYESWVAHER
jgi:hypothetical protein